MIPMSVIHVKKKSWKIKTLERIYIPRDCCERVVSLADIGLSLYKIAEITKYPTNQINDILHGHYDLQCTGEY